MSFTARISTVCGALALLAAAFILSFVFSPQRVEQRRSGAPLISFGPSSQVSSIDIYAHASDPAPLITLARKGANLWEASGDGSSYPASGDRAAALIEGLRDMRRGNLASRDPAKMANLGLGQDDARLVVLHAAGRPDTALLVGNRAASGDEEYVRLRSEQAAYLTRSSIGILLGQDRSYWYDLRVLPADVQAGAIASITVSGGIRLGVSGEDALRADYTLVRASAAQGSGWQVAGQKAPVNQLAAATMVDRVAQLSGIDFAGGAATASATATAAGAGTGLHVLVVTLNGDRYVFRINQGARPGELLLATGWTPWTYVVEPITLARTIFRLSDLLATQ